MSRAGCSGNRLRWHGYRVHWTRRHRDSWPTPLPTPEVLLAWADEHPALRCARARIALADRTGGQTTPADQVILSVLHQRPGPVPIAAVRTALVTAGVAANDNAAKTLINFAPYLRPAGRGKVTTAGESGDVPPAGYSPRRGPVHDLGRGQGRA